MSENMTDKASVEGPVEGTANAEIQKYPIVGIVVIRILQSDGKKVLGVHYLVPGWDGYVISEFSVGRQEDVVAVLPAPPNSFRVQRGHRILGYEFSGGSHPDWNKL